MDIEYLYLWLDATEESLPIDNSRRGQLLQYVEDKIAVNI